MKINLLICVIFIIGSIFSCTTNIEENMLEDGYKLYNKYKNATSNDLEAALKDKEELNKKYPSRLPIAPESLVKMVKVTPVIDGLQLYTSPFGQGWTPTPNSTGSIPIHSIRGFKGYKFIQTYYFNPAKERDIHVDISDAGAYPPWSLAMDWDLITTNKVKDPVFTERFIEGQNYYAEPGCTLVPATEFLTIEGVKWFVHGRECSSKPDFVFLTLQAMINNRIVITISNVLPQDREVAKHIIEQYFDWNYIKQLE